MLCESASSLPTFVAPSTEGARHLIGIGSVARLAADVLHPHGRSCWGALQVKHAAAVTEVHCGKSAWMHLVARGKHFSGARDERGGAAS
jgi:hypothetical protein